MALNIPYTSQKRIVIVGGGFAGMTLAKRLKGQKYQVVLLDRNNYHQFQPLLYQVATSGLDPSDTAFALRKIIKDSRNIYFRMAEVHALSPQNNIIETTIGNIAYDYLVLASGSVTNFYQMENIEAEAMPMKDLSDAVAIRNRMLRNFEQAVSAKTRSQRQSLLNIIVVGGGASGVEIVGAISDMKHQLLATDYPDIRLDDINIFLIEGSDRLLGTMSWKTSVDTYNLLHKKGVRIMLNTIVSDYDTDRVIFKDGSYIRSHNLIWTSGVKVEPVEGLQPRVSSDTGRILTDNKFRAMGHSNIFVIGDASMQRVEKYMGGYPQLATVAIDQAKHLARNFRHMQHAKPLEGYTYKPRPKMATIGRNHAFAEIGPLRLRGFLGWVSWLTIHLVAMMGFRNKVSVLVSWAWSYITYDRPISIILDPKSKPTKSRSTIVKMRLY